MPEVTKSEWKDCLETFPDAHILQTSEWGELKSAFGWSSGYLLLRERNKTGNPTIGAQILFRPLILGFSMAYIPKGPIYWRTPAETISQGAWFWDEIDTFCKKKRSVFLKVEPDSWYGQNDLIDKNDHVDSPKGFLQSHHSIQPMRTIVVNLKNSEEALLGQMKQKTRYNIRLAIKKGVVVLPSSDIEKFYELLKVTSGRDTFGIHDRAYYDLAYELFQSIGECKLLVAVFQGEVIAGLMVFAHGRRAYYFYGASSDKYRELMPTYLLQWEAMRWARDRGCWEYDLWGVPDEDEVSLESKFQNRSDGLWGVYRFKRGFGGHLRRAVGPWDRVYQPLLYRIFRWWLSTSAHAG